MKPTLRAVAAASVAVFAAAAGSYGPSSAALRTACEVLPASRVSTIVGTAVTANARPSDGGTSMCLYTAGHRPIAQLAVTVAETESVAATMLKASGSARNGASRQQGKIIVSIHAMNGYANNVNALLDAAVKNLSP